MNKTYATEVAGILLLFWAVMSSLGVLYAEAAEAAKTMQVEVFLFASAAFISKRFAPNTVPSKE